MIKYILLVLGATLSFHISFAQQLDFESLRKDYPLLVNNEKLCQTYIKQLGNLQSSSPLHLGYLGCLQTIWANHVINPLSKLETFNKGKRNLELAIQKDPQSAELRFLRLSVQTNAPGFLGYKKNIKTDRSFLHNNRNQIKSVVLLKYIDQLLK